MRDAQRKEREITKMKQDVRNTLLKAAQEEMVVFLAGVGGYLHGKISLVPKAALLKFISNQKLGGQAWKKWPTARGNAPIPVNSKDATMELLWTSHYQLLPGLEPTSRSAKSNGYHLRKVTYYTTISLCDVNQTAGIDLYTYI